MNRRSFLAGILAAGVAPAVVRAGSLMKVVARPSGVLTFARPGMLQEIVDTTVFYFENRVWHVTPGSIATYSQFPMGPNW